MKNMSNRMTIQQAAKELGVSTKTLRRWDEKGYFMPAREDNTNVRLYHPYQVGYMKRLLELDRGLKNHLSFLDGIRNTLSQHLGKPIRDGKVHLLDIDSYAKAEEAMQSWEKEYKRLLSEILKFENPLLKATEDYEEGRK